MSEAAWIVALSLGGLVAGLVLLWRGLRDYRAGVAIGDTATSRVATLAAGEVRIAGVVEPAEAVLTSPLQSRACVWYRSEVKASGGDAETGLFAEERAIGFRVRDETGSIRVFPRDARFDVPVRFDAKTGLFGEEPVGLDLRDGPAYAPAEPLDREAAIDALLTVQPPPAAGFGERPTDALGMPRGNRTRRYVEARLEAGDVVTVLGTAVPFGHLPDPTGHDRLDRSGDPRIGEEDPIVAESIARARAAGQLVAPDEAWGNAAIPGFGIGRPVSEPELHPEADRPTLATPEEAAAAERTFDLEPDLLVLAAEGGSPLFVAFGSPEEAVDRHEGRFLVGLLGAVLAIGSAVVLALAVGGVIGG